MFAALLFVTFAQSPAVLPPEVNCCRLLVDVEFLLELDISARSTQALSLDPKAPEYSAGPVQRWAKAKSDAGSLQRAASQLLESQKKALKAEFSRIPERAYREHFLDKVHAVMSNGEEHFKALKPLYDDLAKSIQPAAAAEAK